VSDQGWIASAKTSVCDGLRKSVPSSWDRFVIMLERGQLINTQMCGGNLGRKGGLLRGRQMQDLYGNPKRRP
jgi:hypothetical protein